ncbi:hypothetical protein [Blastococcus sp. VKM Ac-2987]|uniref:hypothetical protein n=1 Tax=Blastococcus sp. VKM Ac-2987 TaxID=3004141 RepID=UPI0022AB5CC1|nr:hypothetical protein [Blastococcus sp. VKM Ac-2987]MCZ2860200.1 hypothetical protein [Blastococcus sp. VKM Ac-2987]
MTGSFARGLAAGAAGTVALNTVSYLDMVLRGRPASQVPEQLVDAVAARVSRAVPGGRAERDARRSALGALAGIANGLGVGVLASTVRSLGVRFPAPVGAVLAGAASAAATDGAVAALGVADPRTWSAADWATDAVPHLAYGAAVQTVLAAVPTPAERTTPRGPARAGLVVRSAVLGVAAGGRSSLGFAGPVLTAPTAAGAPGRVSRKHQVLSAAGVVVELIADKQPGTPPRTEGAVLVPRLLAAGEGGGRLAARERSNGALPVVAGIAGALVGSYAGLGWRRWAVGRMPDTWAALVEDAAALALAAVACLPGRDRRRPVVVPR